MEELLGYYSVILKEFFFTHELENSNYRSIRNGDEGSEQWRKFFYNIYYQLERLTMILSFADYFRDKLKLRP